jgi:hypothetical protein
LLAKRFLILCVTLSIAAQGLVKGQDVDAQTVKQLLQRLADAEARIKSLESTVTSLKQDPQGQAKQDPQGQAAASSPATQALSAPAVSNIGAVQSTEATEAAVLDMSQDHDHAMELEGGPRMHFRGFADFGFGAGQLGNHLIYPLGAPARSTFELGEFDLFISSRLSKELSFVSEVVIGADQTNYWGLDIERLQLTYKPSDYFQISAGRYHTAIGYYNTAFHHGTWFQTATGRPFMYFFEDSGGVLPVHNVGLTATGAVPGTGKLGLHWVAEVGNGRSSTNTGQPVQNFLSDRNHKAVNFAAYIRPEAVSGLQIGGSWYLDTLYPNGVTPVRQTVSSAYVTWINSRWELLNEGVLMQDRSGFDHRTYNSPMMYSQLSRRFGGWRPYFRYQYVNVSGGDPLSPFHGLYYGPSAGIRYDISDYAAMKLQYNRIDLTKAPAQNGIESQLAFTF